MGIGVSCCEVLVQAGEAFVCSDEQISGAWALFLQALSANEMYFFFY
jgi:hypothetical protein